jgi:hypothetical protein
VAEPSSHTAFRIRISAPVGRFVLFRNDIFEGSSPVLLMRV